MSIRESIEILGKRADYLAAKLSQGTTKPNSAHHDRAELSALLRAIDCLSAVHKQSNRVTRTHLSKFMSAKAQKTA